MAQFRAEIKGGKGSISRLGHKTTGISCQANGWDAGIRVEAHHDEDLGDVFVVYQTSGSRFKTASKLLGKLVGDSFHAVENT